MLSPEEVGMNYLMATVSSLVGLLDFGFSPQFGRNFTYVNSGAKKLLKEGVDIDHDNTIDYHLLKVMIETAKFVYRRLSLIMTILMLTAGTFYIWHVTNGFSNVKYSLYIWLIYCIGNYFNVYFRYYSSLLNGSGMITEQNIANILSGVFGVVLSVIMLLLGCGLFSIVISSFLSPWLSRFYSHRVYYTEELRIKLTVKVNKKELLDTFKIIWFNAKKLGINFLGAYAVNKSGIFLVGLFLPLKVVGQYGLLTSLATTLVSVAGAMFVSYMPKFSSLRASNNVLEFKKLLSFNVMIFMTVMLLGSLCIIFLGPYILVFIKSQTSLPSVLIMSIYLLSVTLECNHSNFATLITTKNEIPFVASGLLSGFFIVTLTLISLKFSSLGLLGVVIVPFIVQLCYNNWKWPLWVFKDLDMGIGEFFKLGFQNIKNRFVVKSTGE